MEVIEQLCVKTFRIRAKNGDEFVAQQGKTYTTSVPDESETVTVFSNFWVPVPKEHFVERE